MSKTVEYAKRAAAAAFIFGVALSLLDSSPRSPFHGSALAPRVIGGVFLSAILAVLAGGVGALIGAIVDHTSLEEDGKPTNTEAPLQSQPRASSVSASKPSSHVRGHTSEIAFGYPQPKDGVQEPDERLWASALAEFDSKSRRAGLWAKAFAEANGDESLAKASYLRARVVELQEVRRRLAMDRAEVQAEQARKRADADK